MERAVSSPFQPARNHPKRYLKPVSDAFKGPRTIYPILIVLTRIIVDPGESWSV